MTILADRMETNYIGGMAELLRFVNADFGFRVGVGDGCSINLVVKLRKEARCSSKIIRTMPVGPLRCLAIWISAIFFSSGARSSGR